MVVIKYFLQKGVFVSDKAENHHPRAVKPAPCFQGSQAAQAPLETISPA